MKTNRKIIFVLIMFSLMFLSLAVYLTYFTMFRSEEVSENPYNQRLWAYEGDVMRGAVYDRNGVVLAESVETDSGQIRKYPYKNLYCHVVGYNSQTYGKSQLELKYNNLLLGRTNITEVFGAAGIQNKGYNLELTIDHDLQKLASDKLGSRNGAVAAVNPQTGEVLALVSKPDFNPESEALTSNWEELTNNTSSPLLPRATSGLYPPGSTFKIITCAAAVENNLDDVTFQDVDGYIQIGDSKIYNYKKKPMGELDLKNAFALSSNYAFATLGMTIGHDAMTDIAERFGFNAASDFDLDTAKSSFPESELSESELALTAIGQGGVTATPLQMAMVTAAIANDGVMLKPYLVSKARTDSGTVVYSQMPTKLKQTVDSDIAEAIGDMMVYTVSNGTGSTAAVYGTQVAGKTGTAENEDAENNHAWFVCYAPAENPTIAIAVVLERSGGSGSELAAPIARDMIKLWLSKQK